mmetsp:Transcript_15722/g.25660  ORF Transcript_15722/g.25660 Transcript_15722/m.25660 type:complete len:100 (+) Transcript_15722:259-558(+)
MKSFAQCQIEVEDEAAVVGEPELEEEKEGDVEAVRLAGEEVAVEVVVETMEITKRTPVKIRATKKILRNRGRSPQLQIHRRIQVGRIGHHHQDNNKLHK